ncbi:nucleoside phosphorylase [Croceivirga thetidis]|uniref:Uridine phosphorylase n=1 Tax=Croceivirga thetidis TaxID=2721623 RepID=A0ABX1GR11_9FLAO|nr:nucleoside phosphorylase [Croceivirga thetidis]NKI32377.1 nucleoside phosphorylase [Croceivirga thetidis]
MHLSESELILNSDGSIYHLNLLPEDVAQTIITVGDPDRVPEVSKHFDEIELKKSKREFCTHTGHIGKKRVSVISTGIGTDNIDIVLNELDALFNIDFESKTERNQKTELNIIRIGTSGSIQKDIPVDSVLISEVAIGLEGLLHFYKFSQSPFQINLQESLTQYLNWSSNNISPYVTIGNDYLLNEFTSSQTKAGYTVTNAGFYGPQGRRIRLSPTLNDFFEKLRAFRFQNNRITNLEMETAGIYGMAHILGHKALSINAILANRATGNFSKKPQKTIEKVIMYTLEKIEGLSS